jgi:hypothetical protein
MDKTKEMKRKDGQVLTVYLTVHAASLTFRFMAHAPLTAELCVTNDACPVLE